MPPEVALYVVRLAGERPDTRGRSLSQWDGAELARQRIAAGLVEAIAAATVRRLLAGPPLTPWRHPLWLSPKHPRAPAFDATVAELIALETRPLHDAARVLAVDENTSWPPRCRVPPTQPAQPGDIPTRQEPEDKRGGALNLCAAFATPSGQVVGQCSQRKRQQEVIAVREPLDRAIAPHLKTLHLVGAKVRTHHGQDVRPGSAKHPRVSFHLTPVHCSWMHQVEQWFSILQRKRLRIAEFESQEHLQAPLGQCLREWNQPAQPFNWSTKSIAKVMAEAPALAA